MCSDKEATMAECHPTAGVSETVFYDPETGNVLDYNKENVIGTGYVEDGHLYMSIRGRNVIRPNYSTDT